MWAKSWNTSAARGGREIRVYEGDTLRQSILISDAITANGVDGIAIGYTQAFLDSPAASVKDVNFDGYPDIIEDMRPKD